MRRLAFVLAASFVMAAGQSFAFDGTEERYGSRAEVYFTIPLGAPAKAQDSPRFGFRFDFGIGDMGRESLNKEPTAPESPRFFDLRLGLNGASSLYLNGVDVEQRRRALYAEHGGEGDDLISEYAIPIGIIVLGMGVYAGADAVVKGW